MLRTYLFLALLVAALAPAIGCEADGDDSGVPRGEAPSSNELPDLADTNSLLDENGEPDGDSLLAMYDWLDDKLPRAIEDGRYEFDPEELHELAQRGVGLPVDEAWQVILRELTRRHPGKIKQNPRWIFNSAGSAFCQLALVYASTKEYVAFFGTPIDANGFSGRYKADVWDLMVDGEMWTFEPGQFERTVYLAGDMAYLPREGGKAVVYKDHAWMIDYGRGNVITMFPFGVIAPALFVTLDYKSAWDQFVDYGRLVLGNLVD